MGTYRILSLIDFASSIMGFISNQGDGERAPPCALDKPLSRAEGSERTAKFAKVLMII
jgi:hypothetical protein